MIAAITSIVGGFVFLVGAVWAAMTWFSKPAKQILKAVDAESFDLAKYISSMSLPEPSPSRAEPLQNADALMSYFEATNNKAGQDAIAAVVAAIFAQRDAK
ncbi:MAG: hypothetical protein ACK5JL_02645 [Candidatus Kapaibacterium sp.]|jgi:hypothetical protein